MEDSEIESNSGDEASSYPAAGQLPAEWTGGGVDTVHGVGLCSVACTLDVKGRNLYRPSNTSIKLKLHAWPETFISIDIVLGTKG